MGDKRGERVRILLITAGEGSKEACTDLIYYIN